MPEEKAPKKTIRPVIEEIVPDLPSPTASETQVTPKPPDVVVADAQPNPVTAPQIQAKKGFKINMGFLGLVVIIAVIVALVTGALYVYFNGVNSLKTNPEATPQPSPAQIPTATSTPKPSSSPAVSVELDTYKVSVLNGSGKIGEAGKVKELLEKAGFVVSSTGNAANFGFKATLIQAKTSVTAQAVAGAKEALGESYEIEEGDPLEAKASFDIVVTVGSE